MTKKTFEITMTVTFETDVPDDYYEDAVWDDFTSQTNERMWDCIFDSAWEIQEVEE